MVKEGEHAVDHGERALTVKSEREREREVWNTKCGDIDRRGDWESEGVEECFNLYIEWSIGNVTLIIHSFSLFIVLHNN